MDTWIKVSRIVFVVIIIVVGALQLQSTMPTNSAVTATQSAGDSPAASALQKLPIKGRAPKTGYTRAMFSSGWGNLNGCDLRNYILARDMTQVTYVDTTCKVATGTLNDPYTGTTIRFVRGATTSSDVQIDHVVALGDAWQKGAQQLTSERRYALANDPFELLAVDGKANQNKSDSDAASWLPSNKSFRCAYVARQIAIKLKYNLWVTTAEYNAIAKVLLSCPEQTLPQ